ncbi:30S ribosomal protein S3, partial [bacterium]
LRADIDYGFAEASTTYGNIGVKCWIYRGDIIGDMEAPTQSLQRGRGGRDRDDRRPRREGGDDRRPRRDDNRSGESRN